MTANGNIRHPAWATRSKEYVWDTLTDVFPRGITPTDIDALIELNRCFYVFEGKLVGHRVETGQGLCLLRVLERWPASTAVVIVGEHAPIDRVDVVADLVRCKYGWWDGSMQWGPSLIGPGCLWWTAVMFVEDAARGMLAPATWPARIAELGRPFEPLPTSQPGLFG
jgi:hypothetical protein